MVEVAVGDAHPLFVDLLASVLAERGYEVTLTAVAPQQLIDGVRRRRPDVCLVDHRSLAGRDRGRLLEQLLAVSGPRTKVVVVSTGHAGPAADTASALGVDGVLDKRATLSVLLDGLRRVLDGETVTETLGLAARLPTDEAALLHRLMNDLTARERECLALLVDGRTTGHIGSALSISATTVRTHVRSLLRKLGVHSRLEAASLAVRYELLDGDLGVSRAG